jgi:hypothetical protein
MTDDDFEVYEGDSRTHALEHAIDAAENAMQTVFLIWDLLSPDEQGHWIETARIQTFESRRRDIALKTLLPAADRVLAELRAADS